MDDTLLVSRAMAGDLDSFGQLYDRYFPRVYDFAWRVARDAGEAASVTESIFATAMASLAQLPNAASFRSWLFGIAYRSVVARAAGLNRTTGAFAPAHEEAFGSFDVPDACYVEDPSVAGGDPAGGPSALEPCEIRGVVEAGLDLAVDLVADDLDGID